jgi:holo-[acyl-carrier protein] synthase
VVAVPCVRVGTDVESVAEVAASLERYGDRYTRRLFTHQEVASCGSLSRSAAPRLTARFAAKEAVLKLLAPTDMVPRWRSIEVRTLPNGAPCLELHDEAAELARARGLGPISLSMSHGAGIAMATVVALAATDQG